MPVVKELELNKRYTWKELAEAYPDMWVFLTEVEYDLHKVSSAVLVAVSTFEHRDEVFQQVDKDCSDFIVRRTTPAFPTVGVLW